ncbi:MAG: AsmA family protein [Acetobacteraceae bacterium]
MLKFIGWAIGGLVLLIGLTGMAAYIFATSDFVRAQIENHANAVSGRKTKIARLSVDWGWTPHVHLDDVELSNTDWGKADHMFKAQEIEFDIRLWPLLHGDIVLPRLMLRKPELFLERNAQDESNWSPNESPVANTAVKQVQPQHRHQTPLIGRLEIIDGQVGYIDQKRKLDLSGAVSTATGQAGAEPEARLSLKGRLEGQPLTLQFVGGSALMLRETDKPYPVDLEVAYGDTKLTVRGTIQDPFQYTGADLQLSLAGPDLSEIFPLVGIPGPPTPPYRISGKLQREQDIWRVTNVVWHAGESDLSGDVAIDQRGKPSHLMAHLFSQHLAFADLAPLVGATPGKTGNVSRQQAQTEARLETRGELFPNVPLHVERLRAMNMDVSLDAKQVVAPSYLPVQSLMTRVQVANGRATVRPLNMGFGGGKVTGELSIDAATPGPTSRVNLRFDGVELAAFFRGSRFFDTTDGRLSGRVVLAGTGRSLAQVMDSADGDVVTTMAGGSVSGLLVSVADLQIASALVLYVTGDNRIPIRCAIGRLKFEHGPVVFDKTLMDTEKSVLHLDGEVALQTQELQIKISADPKQFDLLDLHSPVIIAGKIRSPSISLGRKIPIPTPDFGGAKDADCNELTRELWAAKPG